jgi:hypothetical protein
VVLALAQHQEIGVAHSLSPFPGQRCRVGATCKASTCERRRGNGLRWHSSLQRSICPSTCQVHLLLETVGQCPRYTSDAIRTSNTVSRSTTRRLRAGINAPRTLDDSPITLIARPKIYLQWNADLCHAGHSSGRLERALIVRIERAVYTKDSWRDGPA